MSMGQIASLTGTTDLSLGCWAIYKTAQGLTFSWLYIKVQGSIQIQSYVMRRQSGVLLDICWVQWTKVFVTALILILGWNVM
jgi:hypothetical protein